jgi:lipopolysaccharide/colanic/teichoic acid biosynthesis glycosyltransferase
MIATRKDQMPSNLHAHGISLTPLGELAHSRITADANEDLEACLRSHHVSVKRAMDLLLGSLMIVLAGPFILVCAGLIRISSRGPAFYSQTRLGQYGRPFRIHKLRTMAHDCEKTSGARWSTRNDPRVTSIGRFLRITHLDELPQLWNVLKGDMSLVGPRPERPEFIAILEKSVPLYRNRMLVRPGVTGLAQIYLPPDNGIASVRKKVVYDLHYLRTMGVLLDLRLMLATPLQAVGVPCRLVRRMLLLPRPKKIEQPVAPKSTPVPPTPVAHFNGAITELTFESQPEPTA